MRCKVTEEMIYDYVDRELDELTSLIIGEHIRECSRCGKKAAKAQELFNQLHLLEKENIEMPVELDDIFKTVCGREKEKGITLRDYINIQKEIIKGETAFIKYIPGRRLGGTTVTALCKGFIKTSGFLFKQGYKMALPGG